MILAAPYNLQIIRGCTFEAIEFQLLDGDGNAIDATGWTVAAEVRKSPGEPVIVNLAPFFSDFPNGVIRVPAIDDETTPTYPTGAYNWDLLVEDASDNRQQFVRGRFPIIDPITDS